MAVCIVRATCSLLCHITYHEYENNNVLMYPSTVCISCASPKEVPIFDKRSTQLLGSKYLHLFRRGCIVLCKVYLLLVSDFRKKR